VSRRIFPRAPAGGENPAELVAVPLEQQAALHGRPGGVQARDRPIVRAQHAMLMIDRQPAFRMRP
jgi:hypothetical protein